MHKNDVKPDDIVEEVPTMLLCQIDLTDSSHWQEAILRMVHRKGVESIVLETSGHRLWFESRIGGLPKARVLVLPWSRAMQFALLLELVMFFTTT